MPKKKIVTTEEYRKTESKPERILIKALNLEQVNATIEGMSELVTHGWSEQAKNTLRNQGTGRRTRLREKRNPEHAFELARYKLSNGSDGFPVTGIKKALVTVAHVHLGVAKTVVQRGLFIEADEGLLVRLQYDGKAPMLREDIVRLKGDAPDLRYRPEYRKWKIDLRITYDADLLNAETIFNLLERAGWGIGIGEWRPEKGGMWGRFRVARTAPKAAKKGLGTV